MNPKTRQDIRDHAIEAEPNECCGFILSVGHHERVFRAQNSSSSPQEFFRIAPAEWVAAEKIGKVIAVYHSHPKRPATPSNADKAASEALNLPFYIVQPQSGKIELYTPVGWAPELEGREFVHGVFDCYSLVRDYYKKAHNIILPDYYREDKWWEKLNSDDKGMYLDNYVDAGFYIIVDGSIMIGDMILMHLFSPVPNHAAIYIEDNMILHHVQGRVSNREIYGKLWRDRTTHVLRHKELSC